MTLANNLFAYAGRRPGTFDHIDGLDRIEGPGGATTVRQVRSVGPTAQTGLTGITIRDDLAPWPSWLTHLTSRPVEMGLSEHVTGERPK